MPKTNLSFAEAMQAVAEGKKVRRDAHKDYVRLCLDNNGYLAMYEVGEPYPMNLYILSEDITATDWQIIE